jgi:hypothetical protein
VRERHPDEQVRFSAVMLAGKRHLAIRFWVRDELGEWWPDPRRGVALRDREIDSLASTVSRFLDLEDA